MCTELEPGQVMVCDVAIADVKAALVDNDVVTFDHMHGEGTLVRTPEPGDGRFRERIQQAIRVHGGGL